MIPEYPKKRSTFLRTEKYSYPKTAPIAKVGVKIPPGTGQARVMAVKTNFWRI
jgi:hypothetical protein